MEGRTPTSQRSLLDTALRVALTIVVLVLLALGLRMVFLAHRMTSGISYEPPRSYPLDPRDVRKATIEEQRARFPLPLFPGAQDMEFGEMEFNGRPFFRCDYEVSATPEEILNFYRGQLITRGWQDVTEDAIQKAAVIQDPDQHEVLDFQNESFLRYYDHMMRTQASFTRPGGHVMIAVKEGKQPWTSQVGIHYIEYSSPGDFSEDMKRSLGAGGLDQAGAGPAMFAQNMGGQRMETSVLTSRLPPAAFRDELTGQYRGDGWTELDLPPRPGNTGSAMAVMFRGRQMIFMQVRYDEREEVSRAVISLMKPREN